MVNASAGRYFDGSKVYDAIISKPNFATLISLGNGDATLLGNVITDFKTWYEKNYVVTGAASTAWVSSKLE